MYKEDREQINVLKFYYISTGHLSVNRPLPMGVYILITMLSIGCPFPLLLTYASRCLLSCALASFHSNAFSGAEL